ncbi:hypothetical protein MSIBF_A170004 [groundwater metagenome]|uniref:Uncharacterized protein n=1 Tax=groundwater metagenome TaxID=717931 RepID=A0A098E744_9ZZZZ
MSYLFDFTKYIENINKIKKEYTTALNEGNVCKRNAIIGMNIKPTANEIKICEIFDSEISIDFLRAVRIICPNK